MISVIVPVHNAGEFLKPCLDSILAQTHRELEVILVDDGSADDSGLLAYACALRDSRVLFVHQRNRGQAAARNLGLRLATGDWVTFVDDDDVISAEMYSTMLAHAADNDIIACNVLWHYADGTRKIGSKHNAPLRLTPREWFADLILNRRLSATVLHNVWNKLYRREVIRRGNVAFDETLGRGEDIDFNVRAVAHANHLLYLPQPLYAYRWHGGNASAQFRPEQLSEVRAWRNLAPLIADDHLLSEQLQNRIAQVLLHYVTRCATDPHDPNLLRPLHPDHWANILREIAACPRFLDRIRPEQRKLFLELSAAYDTKARQAP